MIETVRQVLTSQYAASLSTLGHCIAKCPDALWNAPVARYPFCQTAFHALIFADLYLGPDEASFRRQPFHLANAAFFGDYEQLEDREPLSLYERSPLMAYLEFCRGKATSTIAAETPETLASPASFPRRNVFRAELHVINIRHIQHHAAQLTLRLRLASDVEIPWVGQGWNDPTARKLQ